MSNISYTRKYSDFYLETTQKVDQYFLENKLTKTGGRQLFFRAVGWLGLGAVTFYTNLIFIQNIWLHLVLGIFTGFCVGVLAAYSHESVHQVFSSEKWHWWHRLQVFYTPILYAFSSLFLVLDLGGYAIFKHRKLSQKIGFWLSKVLHILVFLVLPIVLLGFWVGLMLYFSIMLSSGLFLGFLVEPSHLFKGTSFTKISPETGKIAITWDRVMLNSSANFCPQNRLFNILTGGLNFHLVHSLYPKISHIHYPKINTIIQASALKHNLEYREFDSYGAILKSHFDHLKQMSQAN